MGGSLHRLETLVIGALMLLITVGVIVYFSIRPEPTSYAQVTPVPVSSAVPEAINPTITSVPRAQTPAGTPPQATAGPSPAPQRTTEQGTTPLLPDGILAGIVGGVLVMIVVSLTVLYRRRPAARQRPTASPASEPVSARPRGIAHIRQLFQDQHTDQLVSARGMLLKGAALMSGIGGAGTIAKSLFQPGNHAKTLYELLAIILLSSIVFVLAQRRHVLSGGLLLSLGLLLAIFYVDPPPGLFIHPFGAALLLPIMVVGLVVGARAVLTLGALVIGMLVIAYSLTETPVPGWAADLPVIMSLEVGLLWFTLRIMEGALLAAQQNAESERQRLSLERSHLDLEHQNMALETKLNEQNEARQFIGHFLHEMAGLTTNVRSLLELIIMERTSIPDDEDDVIGTLKDTSLELDTLANDLKILLRKGSLSRHQLKPIHVASFLWQVAHVAVPATSNIELQLDVPDDLQFQGDAALVRRALLTALRNAQQAIERFDEEANTHTVAIRAYEEDGWTCIRIADSGPGFQPNLLLEMRSLVARPEGSLPVGWFSSRQGGTGRGIPLMEQVARIHQGLFVFGNNVGAPGAWLLFKFPSVDRMSKIGEDSAQQLKGIAAASA